MSSPCFLYEPLLSLQAVILKTGLFSDLLKSRQRKTYQPTVSYRKKKSAGVSSMAPKHPMVIYQVAISKASAQRLSQRPAEKGNCAKLCPMADADLFYDHP